MLVTITSGQQTIIEVAIRCIRSFYIYSVHCIALCSNFLSFFFFFFFFVFLGAPVAYGDSQARGQIGTVAASLHHSRSNVDPRYICDLHHSSQQCQILNLLSEARDQTHNLIVPSWICFCCTTTGTPQTF